MCKKSYRPQTKLRGTVVCHDNSDRFDYNLRRWTENPLATYLLTRFQLRKLLLLPFLPSSPSLFSSPARTTRCAAILCTSIQPARLPSDASQIILLPFSVHDVSHRSPPPSPSTLQRSLYPFSSFLIPFLFFPPSSPANRSCTANGNVTIRAVGGASYDTAGLRGG